MDTIKHGVRIARREYWKKQSTGALLREAKKIADEIQTNRPQLAAFIDELASRVR